MKKRPYKLQEVVMKVPASILSICLAFSLWCAGCSSQEPPPPPPKQIEVVKIIKKPAPEKAKIEVKEAGDVKTAAVEEKPLETPEADIGQNETEMQKVTGYYVVKKGDSLSGIAAREAVYKDPLKWPILYRLNMDELGKLKLGKVLPDKELPEGVRLKISSPDEVMENLKSRVRDVWVISVVSAITNEKIVPPAIRLINNGYLVYITRARVKGKDWMRLRVGFFKNRTEANTKGKEIMIMLKLADSWVTKVEKKEFEEFGGY